MVDENLIKRYLKGATKIVDDGWKDISIDTRAILIVLLACKTMEMDEKTYKS